MRERKTWLKERERESEREEKRKRMREEKRDITIEENYAK